MTVAEFNALLSGFTEAGTRAVAACCLYEEGLNISNDRAVLELVKALHVASDIIATLQKDVTKQLMEAQNGPTVSFDELMADLRDFKKEEP